jgi:hypothetical protein
MKYSIITAGVVLLAGVPASLGLVGNASFAQSVPVRAPSQASVVDDKGGLSKHVEAGDDKGGLRKHIEAGDDKGGLSKHVEAGDDKGGLSKHIEAGDDKGGLRKHIEAGDDKGGLGKHIEAGDDKGGLSKQASGSGKTKDSNSAKDDNGHHGNRGVKDDGPGHS